mmetsp:Transcript_10093/g.21850  ORF Transcript_10093/g.21850 Transcript_10093/m.21850 type:complete len:109 (+) Transcript_10093:277-603(+)
MQNWRNEKDFLYISQNGRIYQREENLRAAINHAAKSTSDLSGLVCVLFFICHFLFCLLEFHRHPIICSLQKQNSSKVSAVVVLALPAAAANRFPCGKITAKIGTIHGQ